ncbi:PREDICTED: uncharacterized protein LOC107086945 isoform X2 [Cyprinodon variegatus]|uniref:uncharacterized protein LOC107086945 isoform X2 n=1 Tax=Cyprinodon variegatus TaxID=28743 RepID=UPI0007426E36|nr:PREDICTED: uncharacterized protein LOC107086945 isoform X2 [Cyprinodon variegatus]
MASLQLLFLFGFFASVKSGLELSCTYDYEKEMFCQLAAEQCSQYTLDVTAAYENSCSMWQCGHEQCCCSLNIEFGPGDSCTVEAFNGSEKVDSKWIDNTLEIIKPKAPTIVSVEKKERNFVVKWRTNMNPILDPLIFKLTVSKKEDKEIVFSKEVNAAKDNNLQRYEINGKELEPNTAYVVRVQSKTNLSGIFSNTSNEMEFETPASFQTLYLGIIIALSVLGIILFVSAYTCFVRIKRKWWDSFSDPKKLLMPAMMPQVLKPSPITPSNIWIDTPKPNDDDQTLKMLQNQREDVSMDSNSCGISPGSSDPCYGQAEPPDPKAIINYALWKALNGCLPKNLGSPFPNLELPVSQDQNMPNIVSRETSAASSGIVNRSYFMSLPSPSNQTVDDGSGVNFPDDSRYSCKSDTVNNPDHQALAFLLLAQKDTSPAGRVDQSYQPCKVDSSRSIYDSSRAEFLVDPGYSIKSNTVCSPDQQVRACPLPALKDICSPARVVLSYQQCNPDPKRSSSTEANSASSSSTTTGCGFEFRFERSDEGSINSEFNSEMFVPSGSDCSIKIADGYKPFSNKVEESDVIISNKVEESDVIISNKMEESVFISNMVEESDVIISEKQSSDPLCENKNLNEGVYNIPQTSLIPGLNQWFGPSGFPQTPQKLHLPMMPNHSSAPVLIDSGYKCV